MNDEVFALSPISARATLPSEADYEAIKDAFMETSRGRWFLGEYAKRNRNADTRLVLDAVARIEETLAAQKKPSRDPLLDQALSAFRGALSEAREATQAALDHLASEENLAPLRKGVRVIREIAWRLREIGADGRICDLIDSQVSAIEGAAAKLAPTNLANALTAAFDRIEGRIAAFDADGAQTVSPRPATVTPPRTLNEAALNGAPAATETQPADAFDSYDEALLDLVAREMAAPDTDTAYEAPLDETPDEQAPEARTPNVQAAPARTSDVPASHDASEDRASSDEIDITFASDASEPQAEPILAAPIAATPVQRAPDPESTHSLGASLIANGIVQKPRPSKPDPLAPIRRMSQTEKIAFFS